MDPTIAIPWYKSRIIVGALTSLISKVLVVSGVMPDIIGQHSGDIAAIAVTGIGMAADAVVMHSRTKQKEAPAIASSKASAKLQTVQAIPVAEQHEPLWTPEYVRALNQPARQMDLMVDEPQLPFPTQAEAYEQEQRA